MTPSRLTAQEARVYVIAALPRPGFIRSADAKFRLSQTQRRLAHRYRREALAWEDEGNHKNFASCMLEGRRLWRDAKWHLQSARTDYERAWR